MRIRRMIGMTVFALAATALNAVLACAAVSSLDLPLTPREQAARLWMVAKSETAQKLFPSTAAEPYYYFQHDYRREYGSASLYDRIRLAERVGEQGRARFAAEHGWTKLLGSGNRGIRQGPDSVYWDSRSGLVYVLEAKGGNAQPGIFYGFRQNTNQYTVQSARRILESPVATEEAKVASARVIVAAQKRRLVTGVVRTPHWEGKPGQPVLEGQNRANVRREALAIERGLIQESSGARRIFQKARREQSVAMLKYRAAQSVAILGLAGAAGLAWDAYQQSRAAYAMFEDSALEGSILPHIQTSVAIGRTAQATTLGLVGVRSLGQPGIFKLSARTGLAGVAGAALLPVTFGVEGMRWVVAYHEYGLGRISQRDLHRHATGSSIVAVFTASGAIVGGTVGLYAGGVGALPGASAGAKLAVIVAIPFQYAADYLWEWYYRDFDTRQLQLVNATVEEFYGLDSASDADPH